MQVANTIGVARRSEQMFRDLFELVPEGIGIIRSERFIYANTALAELLGHSRPDALLAEPLPTYLLAQSDAEFRSNAKTALDLQETSLLPALTWVPRVGQPLTLPTYILPVLYDGRPAILVFVRNPTGQAARHFEAGTHPSERGVSESRTEDVLSRLVIAKPQLDLLCQALSAESSRESRASAWTAPDEPSVTSEPPARAEPKQARLLVIDDEPLLGQTLSYAFSGKHDVVVTTSGREALDLLAKDTNFDLVLCDLTMPQVSGAMVFEAVERDHPELLPRFVFMTGGVFTDASSQFMARYHGRQLEKPFNIDEVDELLTQIG